MTDDQHGEGTPQGGGRWNPLPQGDYDDGATAFVELPEGGIDALLSGDSPLAAPGHGYVPPRITATHTDGTPGAWPAPDDGARWPDPNAVPAPPQAADDRFTYRPGATQHWTFEEPAAPGAPGHDVTGEWSIPVAGGELPDESGEYTASSLVEQWGTPPATLPGGAPAPWATDGAGHAWDRPAAPAPDPDDAAGHHPQGGAPDAYGPREGYGPADGYGDYAETEDTGDARDTGEADTPGGTGLSAETAELAEPVASAESGTAPEAEAHSLAEAPERPADGPAGHDQPAGPADASEPATTAPTAERVGSPEAPGSDPEDPEAAAGSAVPDGHSDGAGTDEDAPRAQEDASVDAGEETPEPPAHDDHPLASYVLRVNGADRPVTDAWIGESLLYVLRERLGLAGAKDGCSQGECGACNVQVDGRLVASCLVPAVTAAGSEVRTVEGLAADGQPSDVQRALARCGAVQCGFCVPGMAMTVHDLLEGNPAPTELETRQALCGNLCRCSGYRGVLEAVQEVVAEREASHAGGEPETDEARIPHQAGPGSGGVHPSAFEAPGAFDAPRVPNPYDPPEPYDPAHPYDPSDPYGTPDAYGTPPGPHDQHYGQDGGQA
ncbi:2Fe-2S iron-sulfur cluster-binding protein [Streptomyces sp. NRRL B-3648]|uniref:2Fe-2S iron-sulfur cluster-binding protein n=1 Tax=Streptomyces sp. NRRL B-3648 TaxID=1519493 RepID=UPI0006AE2062|nr:2Fe-2S iron-sulfur cluster-binding protein [Streptomyces sp. NRRL B-3648]